MRITGGRLRGRTVPLRVPNGVRPTSARVREAMFSVIGQDLSGQTVLDACGGSGLLGIEAASRGAQVTTVERRSSVARAIAQTAAALDVALDVRAQDARTVFGAGEWDIVLLDPPYADDALAWALGAAAAALEVLVVEHRATFTMPTALDALVLDKPRRYGDTALSIYWRRA